MTPRPIEEIKCKKFDEPVCRWDFMDVSPETFLYYKYDQGKLYFHTLITEDYKLWWTSINGIANKYVIKRLWFGSPECENQKEHRQIVPIDYSKIFWGIELLMQRIGDG